jgi:hypothetical protein
MKISLILALLFTLAACDKQSEKDMGGPTSAPAQAVPFKGEVYQALDLSEAITLVSADELEHHKGEFNLVCKYTKQGDTLRLVENIFGTTQALYFKITPQGLRANDGIVLYSPTGRITAIEENKLAQQRQQAEQRQIQAEIKQSRVQTRVLRSFGLYSEGQQDPTPNKITITDVSVRLDFPANKRSETAYFSNFKFMDKVSREDRPDGSVFLFILIWETPDRVLRQDPCTRIEKQTEIIWSAVLQAYKDWNRKFPHSAHQYN